MPYISVLIPLFNGEEYLTDCISSVLNQTFSDFEIIIGVNGHGEDGGSVGHFAKKFEENDARIKTLILKTTGKANSLNEMLKHINGEYICLLDCDDLWFPNKLECQVSALKGVAKNFTVIGTGAAYFGEKTGQPNIPFEVIDTNILKIVNPIINSSILMHKSVAYWRSEYEGLEDYDLWMRLSIAGCRFYNIPQILTLHRIHKQSAFNSKHLNPAKMIENFYAISKNSLSALGYH